MYPLQFSAWGLILQATVTLQHPAIPKYSSVEARAERRTTPIMGYNSYNHVACAPNTDLMMTAITAMSNKGFQALGYKYFQVDCGWQGRQRLSNGSITYDSTVFPNGIKPLSDYAIGLGFKWSMYTDQGVYSCDTSYNAPQRPGSLGYETQDAAMFAAWNTEYVKVDNCFVEPSDNAPKAARTDFVSRFTPMWKALNNVGIPNMLICQWGVPYQNTTTNTIQGPTAWTPPISTSFRISDDIAQGWNNVLRIYNQAIHANLLELVGPGHPADMDLLEVGNAGMTVDEQKTHFAVWATFKSALMISTDVAAMSSQTASILSNKDLIAINQDSLVRPVKLVRRVPNDYDVFIGPLSNGDQVLLVVDQSNAARSITVNFVDVGISQATAKDVWTGSNLGSISSITQSVAAHGSIVLRLSAINLATVSTQLNSYPATSGSLSSGAYIASCTTCPNGNKVGGLQSSNGGTLTVSGIQTSQSTADVSFDYINAEIQFLGSSIPNVRTASISINGNAAISVPFPISGYNWNGDRLTVKIRLSGFKTNAANTMVIKAVSGGDAPDFVTISVPK